MYVYGFFSYFFNSRIWLSQLMDDHHLGYITKFEKRNQKIATATTTIQFEAWKIYSIMISTAMQLLAEKLGHAHVLDCSASSITVEEVISLTLLVITISLCC
jgi:hypothetical protein